MIKIITAAVGLPIENSAFLNSLSRVAKPDEAQIAIITNVKKYEPHIERLYVAYDLVKQMATDDKVILTDFRDVIFQKSPTELDFSTPGIYFEAGIYKEEPYNKSWIIRDYGEEFFKQIEDRPITCCGVVTGTKAFIESYLRFCLEELDKLPSIEHGADTSVHARYVYTQNVPLKYWDIDQSPVYTVGLCDYITVSHGKILNENSLIPVMVHQWDRHLP